MANRIIAAPSPHIHGAESTRRIMGDVVLALLPALLVSVYVLGWRVLFVTAVSVVACVAFEYLIARFLLKRRATIGDLSAVVTGLLLAFNLPTGIPWWIVVIGALVAIGIGKMTFGGLGCNPFNPALTGRIFLLIAYPVQMTDWTTGVPDALTGSTILADVKAGLTSVSEVDFVAMLGGHMNGSMGEIGSFALILGGIYLLCRRVISWHIPVAVLGTMAIFGFCLAIGDGGAALWQLPLFHLLAGGALLGAIYMATDYSTSPMTHCGMLIYGVGIGLLTMIIRVWGAYPEGMSFAIFIMNAATPLINKYCRPKRFGTK
ncbi:MAG: RnfABCDGE type electron transport complex subunit D [Alistipes sp.]|nr:RnfABCDGE type electron transport complex subunit D [Alistipes sp.]MBR3590621.1 RnfABCDGE type electron transport complex subunit D [Alistipes sp.]MBR3892040.1 RnfABCDGE type electron transport complex subunit D [Alistipes sp.]